MHLSIEVYYNSGKQYIHLAFVLLYYILTCNVHNYRLFSVITINMRHLKIYSRVLWSFYGFSLLNSGGLPIVSLGAVYCMCTFTAKFFLTRIHLRCVIHLKKYCCFSFNTFLIFHIKMWLLFGVLIAFFSLYVIFHQMRRHR